MLEGFLEVPILQGSSFMSITDNGINFNKNVVKHMQGAEYIIILCNSNKKQIAIQKCGKGRENSIQFYRDEKNFVNGVRFNNREVVQMIVSMMDWNLKEFNYRVDGFLTEDKNSMIFDLNSARNFQKRTSNKKILDESVFDV